MRVLILMGTMWAGDALARFSRDVEVTIARELPSATDIRQIIEPPRSYDLSDSFEPREERRTQGLPSYTSARYAPAEAEREPMQPGARTRPRRRCEREPRQRRLQSRDFARTGRK